MRQLPLFTAITAALLLSASAQSTQAAGASSITGQAIDAKTHKPVMGVRVDLFADTTTPPRKMLAAVTTGKDGSFHLTGLASGQYRVEMTKMGYEVQVLTGLTVRSQEKTIIGEPIALHAASEEYQAKMACNSIVRPEQTGSVYVVCAGK